MRAQAPKRKIEPFAANCRYRHLLHVDGNVASSRLASELHVRYSYRILSRRARGVRHVVAHPPSTFPAHCSVLAHCSVHPRPVWRGASRPPTLSRTPLGAWHHRLGRLSSNKTPSHGSTSTRCCGHMSTTCPSPPICTTCTISFAGPSQTRGAPKRSLLPASDSRVSICTLRRSLATFGSCCPRLRRCKILNHAPRSSSGFVRCELYVTAAGHST